MRDWSQAKKVGAVGVVVVVAAVAWLWPRRSTSVAQEYYYDLSEGALFEAPLEAFAPIEGIGGEAHDGVKAVVVCCPLCEVAKRRIAYLETHTPEYKQKREEARRAGNRIADLTRQWIAENTLVRRVDDDAWHVAASEGGIAVVSSWKQICPEHGEWERLCRP